MSIDSDDNRSLEDFDENVEIFIWVSDATSVDLSVEWIFDEGVDCTTVNEEF